jgi:hypothetical protein
MLGAGAGVYGVAAGTAGADSGGVMATQLKGSDTMPAAAAAAAAAAALAAAAAGAAVAMVVMSAAAVGLLHSMLRSSNHHCCLRSGRFTCLIVGSLMGGSLIRCQCGLQLYVISLLHMGQTAS